MPNVKIAALDKFEGINTDASGNYVQHDGLQNFPAMVRAAITQETKAIAALAQYDEIAADVDGKLIITPKGGDEVQFAPNAAFRLQLLAVKDAATSFKTAVGLLEVTLP